MAQKRHQETPIPEIRVSQGGGSQVYEEYAFCQKTQQERNEEDAAVGGASGLRLRTTAIEGLLLPEASHTGMCLQDKLLLIQLMWS